MELKRPFYSFPREVIEQLLEVLDNNTVAGDERNNDEVIEIRDRLEADIDRQNYEDAT